jgi:DNA polymerase-2
MTSAGARGGNGKDAIRCLTGSRSKSIRVGERETVMHRIGTMRQRGFILQPTYRIDSGKPVVHLFGKLETGAAFLVRLTGRRPRFYLRSVDAEKAQALGAPPPFDCKMTTFAGDPVVGVELALPSEAPPLRDRLLAAGIPCFEADVRYALRPLIEAGIRGSLEIDGAPRSAPPHPPDRARSSGSTPAAAARYAASSESKERRSLEAASVPTAGASADPRGATEAAERGDDGPTAGASADPLEASGDAEPCDGGRSGRLLVFDDPAISPADWSPALDVLSFDIETDPTARRLLAISLYGCGASEMMLLTPPGEMCPPKAVPFETERDLLRAFGARVRELDPDVLTGWNVIDFDLAVLARIAGRLGVPLELGRTQGALRVDTARTFWGASRASIPGRVVLDGIQLMRGAFIRMEDFSLGAVAREILGESKTIAGADRAAEILRRFKEDRPAFVDYGLTDARLALEIVEKLRLVELAVERSRLTGMPPDRVGASIASFDFLYLSELWRRGVVAPTVGAPPADGAALEEATEGTIGGYVLEPEPGLYRNVLMFDFKSLYSSLIRTFQIDPLGYIARPGPGDDPIVAPNGAAFRRKQGILPALLDGLFPRREEAKRAGDSVKSNAIKILMNSCYGVLGTPACRFYNAEIANAITGFGRELLLWSKGWFEEAGHRVLYGDTDSLFVLSGDSRPDDSRRLGHRLVRDLNHDIAEHLSKRWRVESRLELEFETLYLRLLLPRVRGGTAGARKRYAGLVEDGAGARVVFTGMEVVRRDWTELAKRVQRELYERLFSDQPVEEYLRGVVRDLRAGIGPEGLVYRKALRKGIEGYTKSTPPHVAAARKLAGRPGRIISYVITTSGPEPLGETKSPIDYEHYVQKQVRPVAEPVLEILGGEFDSIIGDTRQMNLF